MIYSELIKFALHEMNISKTCFAKEMGISVTTLYRILNGEIVIPTPDILEKLLKKGFDISSLDYNDIYYEYIVNRFNYEYIWMEDIRDGYIKLKHKKCGSISLIHINDIQKNKELSELEKEYIVNIIMKWINKEMEDNNG